MNLKIVSGVDIPSTSPEQISKNILNHGQVENIPKVGEEKYKNSDKGISNVVDNVQEYLKNLVEDKDTLEEVFKFINSDIDSKNTKVEFSYNDKINQMMVQVKNEQTGEVIRSLPPEYLVKLMEKFREDGTFEGILLSRHV